MDDFSEIIKMIENKSGLDVTCTFKNNLERYIYDEIKLQGFNDIRNYVDVLKANSPKSESLMISLIERFLIKETYFYRYFDQFEVFRNVILHGLFNAIKDRRLSIWSAGCSTGAEPYTIALLIKEFTTIYKREMPYILATDISAIALEKAAKRIYAHSDISHFPKNMIPLLFDDVVDDKYIVREEISSMVTFDCCNILRFKFRPVFDVIFCRNVLIYMSKKMQEKLIAILHKQIAPGGLLITGYNEDPTVSGLFNRANVMGSGIFYKAGEQELIENIFNIKIKAVHKNVALESREEYIPKFTEKRSNLTGKHLSKFDKKTNDKIEENAIIRLAEYASFLSVENPVGIKAVESLQKDLMEIIKNHYKKIIIDFSDIQEVDKTAIRLICRFIDVVVDYGGNIFLRGIEDSFIEWLRRKGFDSFTEVCKRHYLNGDVNGT